MASSQVRAVHALLTWRRRRIWPLVLGTVLVAMLFVSGASAASHPAEDQAVHVLTHATSFKSVQVDPKVVAPGDELFIGGTVLRFKSPHKQIGTFGVHCVATGAAGSQILCDAVYILPGGQITGQALLATQPPKLFHVAITGGTGAYRDASGEGTIVSLTATDDDVTFHLGGD